MSTTYQQRMGVILSGVIARIPQYSLPATRAGLFPKIMNYLL